MSAFFPHPPTLYICVVTHTHAHTRARSFDGTWTLYEEHGDTDNEADSLSDLWTLWHGVLMALAVTDKCSCCFSAMKKYGLITRYYFFGGGERVIVGDPQAMKHILVTNSKNYIKPASRIK